MDKRKKKVMLVLGIGSLVLGWRLYVLFFEYLPDYRSRTPGAVNAAPPTPANHSPAIEIVDVNVATDSKGDALSVTLSKQAEIAQRPWGGNPFVQPVVVQTNTQPGSEDIKPDENAPTSPSIRFVGVSRTGSQWLAAADGRIVRIGDRIAKNFEITDIGKDWITIEAAGWRHTFHLGSETAAVTRATERSQ